MTCLISSILLSVILMSQSLGQEVRTHNGRVSGQRISVLGRYVDAFLGIPYAKPPVGKYRFKHPEPPEPWETTVLNASKIAPGCLQPNSYSDLFVEPYRQDAGVFSEDCLYLNVWRPSNSTDNLAVMVWIHGGSFTVGSPSLGVYNGQYIAAINDVIVVSIAYRVGALGFMYLGPDTVPGNMGLMDQRLGIKWTKENIALFGGDSSRITIFGLSSGASSVGHHVLSPLSRDFFNRAILQSGTPNAVWGWYDETTGRRRAHLLASLLDCPQSSDADVLYCLQAADGQNISDLQMKVDYGFSFLPVVDGYFLPKDPNSLLKAGEYKHCEILHGFVANEEALILAYTLTKMLNVSSLSEDIRLTQDQGKELQASSIGLWGTSRDKALRTFYRSLYDSSDPMFQYKWIQQQKTDSLFVCPALTFGSFVSKTASTYMYRYTSQVSSSPYPSWVGAVHTYELEHLFGLALDPRYNFTEEDRSMSRVMMTYWTNFAKSGTPNLPNPVPMPWPKFDDVNSTYLLLRTNLATAKGFRHHECTFIDSILPEVPVRSRKQTTTAWPCGYPVRAESHRVAASHVVVATVISLLLVVQIY